MSTNTEAPAIKSAPEVPSIHKPQSWKLLLTLGGSGALAGLLIVLAFDATRPRIEEYKAQMLRLAVEEVLHAPKRTDTLYLERSALTKSPAATADRATMERVYKGYASDGSVLGYALTASEPGFADQVGIIFGYDPAKKRILGLKVLSSKETPGLGDKIEKPGFTGQFANRIAPLLGVKGKAPAGDASAVEMITGATISSRTVIREMNHAIERWQPLLDKYDGGRR